MIVLPFKTTAPVDIKDAVANHIISSHPETHPDAFKADIASWQRLRNEYEDSVAKVDKLHLSDLEIISKYYGQLVFILTKLPSDIGLQFMYYPAFEDSPSVSLRSIHYERCSVLFNLAAVYSQLANLESRTNAGGIKQASIYYQNAAGVFSILREMALAPLLTSLDDISKSMLPPEFQEDCLVGLEELMLGQAQECAWQMAILGKQFKNAVLARVSKKVSSYYSFSLSRFQHIFPTPTFVSGIELQALHFQAVSQYRKSDDDHANRMYGEEITRLTVALRAAQQTMALARSKGLPYETGANFVQTLTETLARSKKDNDFIYNMNPPAESRLPEIVEFAMVKQIIPDELMNPQIALRGNPPILGNLLGWGASVAIDLYQHRKENWVQDEVTTPLKDLDHRMTKTLADLSLPAALDALSKPIGIPPSLLRKSEEVRLEEAPERLRIMSENIRILAERDAGLLNEALDILDQEASEDEALRAQTPGPRSKTLAKHLPSHQANTHLISKSTRYRKTLDQALESDSIVQAKLDEIEDDLHLLCLPEDELETIVPSSTGNIAISKTTISQTRQLRALLEQLTDLQRTSKSVSSRVDHLSRNDDIRPRIQREASDIETWTKVEPAMFESVIEEEVGKYDKFKREVDDLAETVDALLENIKEKNAQFLASRKDDASVKARERMLQKLELAYHKYKESLSNLEEGMKFYNDLGALLTAFKGECKEWVFERRGQVRNLANEFEGLSLKHDNKETIPERVPSYSEVQEEVPTYPQKSASSTEMKTKQRTPNPPPNLNSDEWETLALPTVPTKELGSQTKPTKTKRKTKVAEAA